MSDRCDHIRGEIRAFELQIETLQEQLKTAAGALKQALVFLIKRTQAELADRQADLLACEAAQDPPLTDPAVFGTEITQGLPEYELVAGKDTLARVFVGARQPEVLAFAATDTGIAQAAAASGLHFDVPPFASSRLDYALLEVTGPDGVRFEVPATMSGTFTNFSKSLSEGANVNFYLAGDQIARSGAYGFLARFYRDGQLVGTRSLGTRRFERTKDLRLLIVVDTFPMPVDAWRTVFRALEFLHRNLPVRAGIAPMDSDRTAGLRFHVDPEPFDPDWPQWGPVADHLQAFNAQQAAAGRPDRADKIMTVRTQQPGESPLGGTAQMPGRISGVVLNVNPPGDGYFATIVSQEVGHNFNLGHAQASLIPAASAFDLLNRASLATALNIMFNPVGGSEFCLFSPQDWSTIRQGLLALDATGPV